MHELHQPLGLPVAQPCPALHASLRPLPCLAALGSILPRRAPPGVPSMQTGAIARHAGGRACHACSLSFPRLLFAARSALSFPFIFAAPGFGAAAAQPCRVPTRREQQLVATRVACCLPCTPGRLSLPSPSACPALPLQTARAPQSNEGFASEMHPHACPTLVQQVPPDTCFLDQTQYYSCKN